MSPTRPLLTARRLSDFPEAGPDSSSQQSQLSLLACYHFLQERLQLSGKPKAAPPTQDRISILMCQLTGWVLGKADNKGPSPGRTGREGASPLVLTGEMSPVSGGDRQWPKRQCKSNRRA